MAGFEETYINGIGDSMIQDLKNFFKISNNSEVMKKLSAVINIQDAQVT